MEKELPKRIINRHYIGVVKEINGNLRHVEIDIPQDNILIEEIDAMKDNENRTLMDVQQRFTEVYPYEEFCGRHYDYLYPMEYTEAYVNGVNYPVILTYDKYKKVLEEHEEWIRNKYINEEDKVKKELEIIKAESEEKYIARVEEIVARKMTEYINRRRKQFEYKRFIYAQNYTTKLREIKKESNVKMYSTDQIGWKDFEYKVNDDITVYIKTNFGYGSASYFFCNLKYKDINILPYSWPVKYYYVEMIDFVRYTRRYLPSRISWDEVFDFTVLTANMAKNEPELFVKKWIVNEVEEMMKGMRSFMSKPDKELEVFLNVNKEPKIHNLREVAEYTLRDIIRNCNNNDREEYKAFPQEKVMAFKAEKITGCLLLLDNLRKLTEIASVIIPYITEIEQMNKKLRPEIERHLTNIEVNIDRLYVYLNLLLKDFEPLNTMFESHKMIIERMLIESNETREGKDRISRWEVEKRYEDENHDYKELKNKIKQLTEKKEGVEKEIKLREKFHKILTKCKKRIEELINVA